MCWHKWKVKEKEILPSTVEQLIAGGAEKLSNVTSRASRKPCIITYQCEKCGAEKVTRI